MSKARASAHRPEPIGPGALVEVITDTTVLEISSAEEVAIPATESQAREGAGALSAYRCGDCGERPDAAGAVLHIPGCCYAWLPGRVR